MTAPRRPLAERERTEEAEEPDDELPGRRAEPDPVELVKRHAHPVPLASKDTTEGGW
jgi:hypothetical protein